VLRDYCTFGLLPQAGEYVLACPPEIEAAVYGLRRARSESLPAPERDQATRDSNAGRNTMDSGSVQPEFVSRRSVVSREIP
jgi:hypothetical protein